MSRFINTVAALALVVVAAGGCYTVNANLPGTLRNDVKSDETDSVGSLNIEKTNYFFLWALIGNPTPDFFSAEIKQQVQSKGADGVSNLTYESQTGCVDLIITGVTGGCVAPRTYKVTGSIVRIKSVRLPGKPAKAVDNGDIAPLPERLATAPASKQSY